MNHGYCKNCWWWKEGRCYMQNGKGTPYKIINEDTENS